jgi:hypothetical protein
MRVWLPGSPACLRACVPRLSVCMLRVPGHPGAWGQRQQTFFDIFYGESVRVRPGHTYHRATNAGGEGPGQAYSLVVWLGAGTLNGLPASTQPLQREFVALPGTATEFECAGDSATDLVVYLFFPLRDAAALAVPAPLPSRL